MICCTEPYLLLVPLLHRLVSTSLHSSLTGVLLLSPPLTDPNLGSSEAQHIPPLLPLPHVHSSLLGPEKQCHTSHMGSATHCRLCVTIIPVPTGPSPGPGAQRMLSICRLAAGSVQPHLQATLFLSKPFQFLSLSTAFTPHAFNSSQVARGERHVDREF